VRHLPRKPARKAAQNAPAAASRNSFFSLAHNSRVSLPRKYSFGGRALAPLIASSLLERIDWIAPRSARKTVRAVFDKRVRERVLQRIKTHLGAVQYGGDFTDARRPIASLRLSR
jgi:hypothetical protein